MKRGKRENERTKERTQDTEKRQNLEEFLDEEKSTRRPSKWFYGLLMSFKRFK